MCHQAVSLVSRHLEASGIPTVVIGSARDIVEECGVARFLFVDFPLGNPTGKPHDISGQSAIVDQALALMGHAWEPRTTVMSPQVWDADDDGWRDRFLPITDENQAELAAAGVARRERQAQSGRGLS